MSSLHFNNSTCGMVDVWYESHKSLVISLCQELDCLDKAQGLIDKLLEKPPALKKLKDGHRPKRSKSAFMYFCDDKRKSVADKYVKYEVGVIAKELGAMWHKQENRKKYDELAEIDKQRYACDMEEYKENMLQFS